MQKKIKIIYLITTIIMWLYAFVNYRALPNKIVAHLNLQGHVNRYDNKATLWLLLIIFTALGASIIWLSNKKELYNANNKQFKNNTTHKTATLYMLPYIGVIGLTITIIIIEKTKHPNLDISFIIYALGAFTIVYLFSFFIYIYKNLSK